MKLHRYTSHENDEMRTQEWPQFVQMMWKMMTYMLWMNSFVYTAETAYDKKNPKMPDQACANGLQLHGIPQDVQNILPLERRVISPQILFITILVMR